MKNTRTLISSSIVSIIIMVLGMFMLCMSRAPKISFDEPLIEGGGVEYDSVDVNDDDFLSLLADEESDDMTFTEDNAESVSDDDFLSLLNEVEEGTTTYDQSSESGDEGLDEILSLLELDENAGSENLSKDDESEIVSDSDDSDWLQALTEAESAETTTQASQSEYSEMESIDQLSKEVEHLESVLAEKNATAENLQAEITQFDQQSIQSQNPNQRNIRPRNRLRQKFVTFFYNTAVVRIVNRHQITFKIVDLFTQQIQHQKCRFFQNPANILQIHRESGIQFAIIKIRIGKRNTSQLKPAPANHQRQRQINRNTVIKNYRVVFVGLIIE